MLLASVLRNQIRETRSRDCRFEVVRLRDGPLRHITAVRPTANAQLRDVGDAAVDEILDAPHHVLEVGGAPIAAIHLDEFLAVTDRTANIGIENGITSGRKELAPDFDGVLPIACRPSMDQCDEREFILWIGSSGFQESRFNLQTVEGFVFVEFGRAEGELFPGIIEVRKLSRRILLIPQPEFGRRRGGLSRENDFAGVRDGEGVNVARRRITWIFAHAFRRKTNQLVSEAIFVEREHGAVFRPSMLGDGAIEAGAGEIACGALVDVQKHQVMRRGAVHAGANVTDRCAVVRYLQVVKRAVWSEDQPAGATWNRNRKNSMRLLIGFRMIGGADDDAVAGL